MQRYVVLSQQLLSTQPLTTGIGTRLSLLYIRLEYFWATNVNRELRVGLIGLKLIRNQYVREANMVLYDNCIDQTDQSVGQTTTKAKPAYSYAYVYIPNIRISITDCIVENQPRKSYKRACLCTVFYLVIKTL